MRLAVSNIAWDAAEDEAVAGLLSEEGVTGVEIAPTRYWADLGGAASADVQAVRDFWSRKGLKIVAAQSLLYGRPDLTLFDSPQVRRQTEDYLRQAILVCAGLGARSLVFGSPGHRQVGGRSFQRCWDVAVRFFRRIGDFAFDRGTRLCIEPNPAEYGCDFVTRASEGFKLVEAVDSPGFALHLDSAAMHLSGDDPREAIERFGGRLSHFHFSAPYLEPPGASAGVDYGAILAVLKRIAYSGWISIEMRPSPGETMQRVRQAVNFVGGFMP